MIRATAVRALRPDAGVGGVAGVDPTLVRGVLALIERLHDGTFTLTIDRGGAGAQSDPALHRAAGRLLARCQQRIGDVLIIRSEQC